MAEFLEQVRAGDLEEAIFRTVAFFDVLDFCLTAEEISDRLLGFDARKDEVKAGLLTSLRVVFTRGFYHLTGREKLVSLRLSSVSYHERLLKKTLRLMRLFRRTPFLDQVYLCNTLAMTQVRAGSDIDLFVVAKPGRLFFVRIFLLFFTHIFGLRRHGRYIEGRVCLSFFVDSTHLDFSPLLLDGYDPYFAYWTAFLRPLYLRSGVQILPENPWIREYFCRDFDTIQHSISSPGLLVRGLEYFFGGRFGDVLESWLSRWQLARAKRKYETLGKPDGVVLLPYCLKFHDKDMRKTYRDRWEALISS